MPKRQGGSAGMGPNAIAITTTGAGAKMSSWHPFGPCLANSMSVGVFFASTNSTAATVKLQGLLSTELSTGAVVTIATRTYAQRTSVIQSTVATVVTRVRMRSSGGAAAAKQTVVFGAGE